MNVRSKSQSERKWGGISSSTEIQKERANNVMKDIKEEIISLRQEVDRLKGEMEEIRKEANVSQRNKTKMASKKWNRINLNNPKSTSIENKVGCGQGRKKQDVLKE